MSHLGPLQRLSLRHKLPLFLIGLTATALVVAGLAAWGEVRTAASAEGESRLRATARQLGDLSGPGQLTRANLETHVGTLPSVRAALAGRVDSAALASALDTLVVVADGPLPIEIWSGDRRRVFGIGRAAAGDSDSLPPLEEERAWGPFQRVGGTSYYWTSAPIESDDRIVGWLAQRRRLGNPQTADALARLIGGDLRILIGHPRYDTWVDFSGETQVPPPRGHPLDTVFAMEAEEGVPVSAVAAAFDGTPWTVLVQLPTATVNARPLAFLRRMTEVGVVLLLVVFTIGLIVSRRLSAPIVELAVAADAIRAGGYGKRVHADGADELARLGGAFNAMSEQVARTDEQLRQRLEEARALAERLEEANVAAERAREEAQAASRAKSDFLATMSHEIRTPINAVIGYTELLTQGIPDPATPGQRGYLERIERSSRLLITLVNDVLDFARIESGTLTVRPGTGSAAEAIQAARAALEPQAAQKGVDLSSECDGELSFRGDADRVQQILLNLLSNAVKFTARGGSVRITCASTHEGPPGLAFEGPWLRTDVEDTGIGIAAEQLDRVFEPFVQADTGFTREHGGVGLGLAISRKLARMLDGEVTARSAAGKGSCFTLWLREDRAPTRARVAAD